MINTCNPIQERPVRIAIAGCGRISEKHIISIIHHYNSAKLVALCDINLDNLHRASRLLNLFRRKQV